MIHNLILAAISA